VVIQIQHRNVPWRKIDRARENERKMIMIDEHVFYKLGELLTCSTKYFCGFKKKILLAQFVNVLRTHARKQAQMQA
jgi:hypothetical protein